MPPLSRLILGLQCVGWLLAPLPGVAQGLDAGLPEQPSTSLDEWRLVRTPNPAGGPDAISIMRTADVSRSDVDLAGLMLRCGGAAIEAVVVLTRPLRRDSHPAVTVGAGAATVQFMAKVVTPGALVLLPQEALEQIPWQAGSELSIALKAEQSVANGIVSLAGLAPKLQMLRSACATR
jgi:hypothetical protein